ncbi:hypothetical protein M8J77_016579 [Diaphorina citri]|nr:hypothetical protein M8J77_016579 [Diaphorina citri]
MKESPKRSERGGGGGEKERGGGGGEKEDEKEAFNTFRTKGDNTHNNCNLHNHQHSNETSREKKGMKAKKLNEKKVADLDWQVVKKMEVEEKEKKEEEGKGG